MDPTGKVRERNHDQLPGISVTPTQTSLWFYESTSGMGRASVTGKNAILIVLTLPSGTLGQATNTYEYEYLIMNKTFTIFSQ